MLPLVLVAAFCAIGAASAQERKSVWSGVYTEGQAERGAAAYTRECSVCHMDDLHGDQFASPLIDEAFAQRWQDTDVGELFTIVKGTMPATNPQSLTSEMYADIVAYLLKMNKYPAGQQELGRDPAELAKITFKKS